MFAEARRGRAPRFAFVAFVNVSCAREYAVSFVHCTLRRRHGRRVARRDAAIVFSIRDDLEEANSFGFHTPQRLTKIKIRG
jgi:hypothetical protein